MPPAPRSKKNTHGIHKEAEKTTGRGSRFFRYHLDGDGVKPWPSALRSSDTSTQPTIFEYLSWSTRSTNLHEYSSCHRESAQDKDSKEAHASRIYSVY